MKTGHWLALLLLAITAAWWTGRRSGQRYDVIAYGYAHRDLTKIDRWTGKSWRYYPKQGYWIEIHNLTPEQVKAERAFDALVSGLKPMPSEGALPTAEKSP